MLSLSPLSPRSLCTSLPHTHTLCRDLNPSSAVLLSCLVRNLREGQVPRRVDQLAQVKLLPKSFHDVFVAKTRLCGSNDSQARRICNWLSSCTQRVLINVGAGMMQGLWYYLMGLRAWSLPLQRFCQGLRLEKDAGSLLSKWQMVQSS